MSASVVTLLVSGFGVEFHSAVEADVVERDPERAEQGFAATLGLRADRCVICAHQARVGLPDDAVDEHEVDVAGTREAHDGSDEGAEWSGWYAIEVEHDYVRLLSGRERSDLVAQARVERAADSRRA